MKYRKKPVVIDAWKWTGKITDESKDIVTKPPYIFEKTYEKVEE